MIKKILISIFVFFFFSTCVLLSWYYYYSITLIPRYEKKLSIIAQERFHDINSYLKEQENNARKLSTYSLITNTLMQNNLKHNILSERSTQELTSFFAVQKEDMHFKNVFLINAHGAIVFSTFSKNIINTIVTDEPYINSSLGKSYERASMTLTVDFSTFNFNELLGKPALFITIPMLSNRKFIGALCYQLDESKIYERAHQYIGLGKTGEIALGKKEGDYVVFVAPTRNDPDVAFKKRILFSDPPISIQAATLGQEGSGTAIDYRGKEIVGAWRFIPKLDWGMIVKIDQEEIMSSLTQLYTFLLFFLLLFLLYIIVMVWYFFPLLYSTLLKLNTQFPLNRIPSLLKNPLFILFLCSMIFAIKNGINCKKQQSIAIEAAKNKAMMVVNKNAEAIDEIVKKISFIGDSIAHDLDSQYLKKDDISIRLKRDLKENALITNITIVLPDDKHNPLVYNFSRSGEAILKNYSEVSKERWYVQALKKKSLWLAHINSSEEAIYCCSFFDSEHHEYGVVAITFSLTTIINNAESISISQTGYSIILNNDNTFIFHPIENLMHNGITFLQYAQSKGNEELAVIAMDIAQNKSIMHTYSSEITKEPYWIYTASIPTTQWIIGTLFSENEIGLSLQATRHYYFWIIIWAMCTLLLLCALACNYNYLSITHYFIAFTVIVFAVLILCWYAIQETTIVNKEKRIIITDLPTLNKFLNDLRDDADRKHEPAPIIVPCGILLYSLSFANPNQIILSGYVWNKYDISLPFEIDRGIDLPQAQIVKFGTALVSKTDSIETVTTTIQGTLFQEQNYALYPFDQQYINIIIEHRDIEKNIILTPDLSAYKKISPEFIPGFDKGFVLPGFTIEQAFFEYKPVDPTTNFGFKEHGKVTDHYQLIYNAILNRDLLTPFIFYLLPLFVVLFSLFSTLLISTHKTDPLTVLGAYSALFFALILLQRSLREQYPTGTTMYMEYAFFYTYITIILLILHIILISYYRDWKKYQDQSLYYMKILFWPFQCISWLITTLIVFY